MWDFFLLSLKIISLQIALIFKLVSSMKLGNMHVYRDIISAFFWLANAVW